MSNRLKRADQHGGTALVWLPLALLLAALALLPAHALASPAAGTLAETAALDEELEEEFELEEEAPDEPGEVEVVCEELEEGLELCEEIDGTGATENAGAGPPDECLLQTARARARFSRHRLSLVLSYTSSAPTRVYVDFRLRSGGRSLRLGLVKRRFSRKGRLRVSRRLSDAEMERARAARHAFVTFDVPAAPGYCRRYFKRHLVLKKGAPPRPH
jgi:hypothetical protein